MSKYSNALLEILQRKPVDEIKIDGEDLAQLGREAAVNFTFEDFVKIGDRFLVHTLAGTLPDRAENLRTNCFGGIVPGLR